MSVSENKRKIKSGRGRDPLQEQLRKYNRWRRGDGRLKMPDPKKLGELIDEVADRLEVLEREHSEFFERWHVERRKREKMANDVERCYQMLLSEHDTNEALFKAENILREALTYQKSVRAVRPNSEEAGQ